MALLLVLLSAPMASAQESSIDDHMVVAIHEIEAPYFVTTMRAAQAISWPLFIGTPASAWGLAVASESDRRYADAFKLTVAHGITFSAVALLKHTVRRERPYVNVENVDARQTGHLRGSTRDPFSFPSGHAAAAFGLATSLTVAHTEWYVWAPAYFIAGAISISRVWHGVHYVSDIAAGAALGTGVSILVQLLEDQLVPDRWQPDSDGEAAAPAVYLRFTF